MELSCVCGVSDCFEKALHEDGPVWIDCAIGKDEVVLPMIPGGGGLEDIIMT